MNKHVIFALAMVLLGISVTMRAATAMASGGITRLAFADFKDGAGSCSLDGWTIVAGVKCYTPGSCPLTQADALDCCDNFICPIDSGSLIGTRALQADKDTCTNGSGQWRLERTFDTTGLTKVRVCFDYADKGATGGDDILQIDIEDDTINSETIFCDADGPRDGVDEAWHRRCVYLPLWAENNPGVTVEFFLHSDDGNASIYLDNIDVYGWSGDCPETFETILIDDFNTCSLAVWNVTGAPLCPASFKCDGTNNLSAMNSTVVIDTIVDTTTLDDQVELCFDIGDNNAGGGEEVVVEFDAGDGWILAWSKSGNLGINNTCGQVCVNLSNISTGVTNNPLLGIQFSLTSNSTGDEIVIDNVQLRGAQNCWDSSSAGNVGGLLFLLLD